MGKMKMKKYYIDNCGLTFDNPQCNTNNDTIVWYQDDSYTFYGNCTLDKYIAVKAIKTTVPSLNIESIIKSICDWTSEFTEIAHLLK